MRVGVIGAGAVGGAIAAVLARAGHEVEVTARGENLAAIRENGIHLSGAWGDYVARVDAVEILSSSKELIVVATKAQDAVAAISENERVLGATPIVLVQNGLSGLDAAHAAAPRSDIVGALSLFAASYLSPGEVAITTPGETFLGVRNPENDVPARYAAAVLGAVMPVVLAPDFIGAQWTKLLVNHINALPAITGLSAQETIAHPGLRRILTASMRESVRIAHRSKVRFAPMLALTDGRLRLFAALPLWAGQVLPRAFSRRMGSVANPGSTLQSIRRGQKSEIDYLNGAVVDAAASVGTTAPINAALVGLVHDVETSGRFFTPAEVVDRVPLG
jgi:2-dehydropantoate 2-reductase